MSQIQQVKDASDIIEVIGQRLELKRSGRNWRGLCPFHSEHTPSFFVSEELQRYKCFGCGQSGDVLEFLQKYEGMTFSEALKYLADQAGITLQEYQPTAADQRRVKLLEVLDLAKEYYHFLLTKHEVGQPARDYLKRRGTNQESIRLFQLGCAPGGWDGLVKYLHRKKKYPLELLVQAGLVINRRGRYYDRFRERLIFPLKNHRGQIVGFSGRSLKADVKEAKYINTPETDVYHKAELLFGYSELLQFIRKLNQAIVVEGEFDVISSAQVHVNNIVAIKGSAFTAHHARYLKRVADQILLALDMDAAGIKATRRAIPIAQEAGLELRVIKLAESVTTDQKKDPDDLARQQPQEWREKVKHSISAYQFLIEAALAEHDPRSPEGKAAIVTQLAPVIGRIPHEVEKDYYLKELAQQLEVKPDLIRQDMNRLIQASQTKGKTSRRSPVKLKTRQTATDSPTQRRLHQLLNYAWFLLLHTVDDQVLVRAQKLADLKVVADHQLVLLQKLLAFKPSYSLEKFSQFLPTDLNQALFDLYLQPNYQLLDDKIDLDAEWKKTLAELSQLTVQLQVEQITAQLDQLDRQPQKTKADLQRQQELLEKIVSLKTSLKAKS